MERAALDADDLPVLLAALSFDRVFAYDSAKVDDLIARTTELTKHADPGVRGKALERLGALYDAEIEVDGKFPIDQLDARQALVDDALSDDHPYVRGNAMILLSRLFFTPSILDKLVALADDSAKINYAYEYEQAGGGYGKHVGDAIADKVGDDAIGALQGLASMCSMSNNVPEIEALGLDRWTGLESGDVAAMRAWYAENKAAIAKAYPAALAAATSQAR